MFKFCIYKRLDVGYCRENKIATIFLPMKGGILLIYFSGIKRGFLKQRVVSFWRERFSEKSCMKGIDFVAQSFFQLIDFQFKLSLKNRFPEDQSIM